MIVSAAPGDAATNSAMEIRSLLRHLGPSELYAAHVHPDLEQDVLRLVAGSPPPIAPSDIVIFHATIGSREVFDVLWMMPQTLVVYYHNVSPSSAFEQYSPEFATLLRTGRKAIAQLARRTTLALAPSAFNAAELAAMGFRDPRVSPLIVNVERLRAVDPHPLAAEQLAALEGPLLLSVGQFLPHKRPEFLLQAFHVLSTYLVPGAQLALIGASRLPAFRSRLDRYIRELNLSGVHMVGEVPDQVLRAYFERADIFTTASEHEGFCVPLVEAMMFDVPIVARCHGAIPETLAGAGLLVAAEDGPFVYAEALCELVVNASTRARLVEAGRARASQFHPDVARRMLLEHLLDVA